MVLVGPFGPLAQAAIWARAQQSTGGAPAVAPPPAPATTAPASPFGKGKAVMVLGDSHTAAGSFGKTLESRIGDTGSKVTVDAKSGVSPTYYFDRIEKLVREKNPDTIVIALGTNYREDGDGKTQGMVNAQVQGLVKRIRATGSTAQIIWVGPPRGRADGADDGRSLQVFDTRMRNALGKEGTYVASSDHTRYEGRDGVHYGAAAGKRWADAVFDAMVPRGR